MSASTKAPLRVPATQMLAANASVTVVIPCYNYARYLGEAVDSALNQSGIDVDVVIVDDCSTDSSFELAQSLAAVDGRIRVIRHSRNTGPVQTFNDGLDVATGEFLVRLDADDLLTPGSLSRSVALMQAYPDVGLAYGHPVHFVGNRPSRVRLHAKSWTIWNGHAWLTDRCRDGWCVITSPEVLMRSSVVRVVGGQKDLAHTHDMEMWMRLAAHADVAYIHGADQAWHRDHPNSLSAAGVDTYKDLLERRQAFDVLFDGLGSGFADIASLQESVKRALAEQAIEFANRQLDRNGRTSGVVDAYIAFAREQIPELRAVPGWSALEKTLRSGELRRPWSTSVLTRRAGRWWRHKRRSFRWHREGVY